MITIINWDIKINKYPSQIEPDQPTETLRNLCTLFSVYFKEDETQFVILPQKITLVESDMAELFDCIESLTYVTLEFLSYSCGDVRFNLRQDK